MIGRFTFLNNKQEIIKTFCVLDKLLNKEKYNEANLNNNKGY